MVSSTRDPLTRTLRSARVAVVAGGEPHRDIAWPSIERIVEALRSRGYDAELVDAEHRDFVSRVTDFDVAFVAHFGLGGDDGILQGLLASLRIPYTGSGCRATAVAQDKVMAKALFRSAGLLTPDWIEFTLGGDLDAQADQAIQRLGLPLVVKPTFGGGSYGMSLATDKETVIGGVEEASAFGRVFGEAFVRGETVTSGVLGTDDAAGVLPAHGVRFMDDRPFLDSKTLFTPGTSETFELDPGGRSAVISAVEDMAARAHRLLRARGLSRSDFKVDFDDRVWILELNTQPAMSPVSDLPIAAARLGLSFEDLVETILETALARSPDEP